MEGYLACAQRSIKGDILFLVLKPSRFCAGSFPFLYRFGLQSCSITPQMAFLPKNERSRECSSCGDGLKKRPVHVDRIGGRHCYCTTMADFYEVWSCRGSVLAKLEAMLEDREAAREQELKAATDIKRVYRGKVRYEE